MQRRLLKFMTIAALAIALAGCGDDDDGGADAGDAPTRTTTGSSSATAGTLTISNFSFGDVSVEAGGTVNVENEDAVPHTVTADENAFDTGNIGGGDTTTFTAPAEPGDYPFHCNIHANMKGTLTVT